jgi:adenine-specific DNA-methyltransferase
VLFYARDRAKLKFRRPYREKTLSDDESGVYRCVFDEGLNIRRLSDRELAEFVESHGDVGVFRLDNITGQLPSISERSGIRARAWVLEDRRDWHGAFGQSQSTKYRRELAHLHQVSEGLQSN